MTALDDQMEHEAGSPTQGSPALTPVEVHDRSDLGRHLRGSIFPADRSTVIACAVEEHAPTGLIEWLQTLPEGEYHNVEGVWEALGGRRDERTPAGEVEDPVGAAAPRVVLAEPAEPLQAPRCDRFAFRFAGPFRLAAMPFLVNPTNAWVAVTPPDDQDPDGSLIARFGPWVVRTSLGNVAAVAVTGPYAIVKTIGPPHISLVDRGLTFASNRDRGVCIQFVEPVPGIDALGLVHHPALTVTVDDVDGLVEALSRATDPGSG